ncbi:wax ester/triacylglycerol synthase domain-containing protein, partial [Microbacterium sp.]|uniref:wax ester/triacylglycerol synthase domain-containing protein n=1 Tax=Microbacterium sp. TaxID=51671 RepID=UPI003C75FD1B
MRTASAPGARGRQRLSPEDEVNLLLDSGDNVYVVTIVGSFAPGGFVDNHGGIDLDLLRAGIAERIARVPRLRQRLEFDSGKWWLSQADADLTHHVREIAPAADRAAFEQRCADLSAMRLPLDRPLWELLAMPSPDGLAPASWIFRVHHVVADGVTAASLLGALFDADVGEQSARPAPDPRTSGPPRPDPPAPPTLRHWHRAALRVAIRIQSAAGLTRALLRRMPPTVLLGPLGFGRG